MAKGITYYSKTIPGAPGNYKWRVRFDKTNGFVGISMYPDQGGLVERVLLSPRQFEELVKFMTGKNKKKHKK